jgi:hypothetical protein
LNGILDPIVYAGTPITTATRNGLANIAGYLIYNSTTSQYEYNNGTTWLPMGGAGAVTSVYGRVGAVVAANGDYLASQVTNVPSGSISAVTVQAALNELDTEKIALTSTLTGLSLLSDDDITNTDSIISAFGKIQGQLDLIRSAAPATYTASDITNVPAGSILSTNVQAALNGLDAQKESIIAAGTITQYWRGDKTWQTLPSTTVEDLLTSVSTTNALSANQGRILNAADIASGVVTGTDLILTLKGGSNVTVDVTTLLADVKLQSGVYNSGTKALDLTLSNATVVSIPVSDLLPVLTDGTLTGDGANTPLAVNMSGDVTITSSGVTTVIIASDTVAGKVELATIAETETGTSTTLAVTPADTEATYVKKSILNAKGDVIVATADNTPSILSLGATGQVLTVNTALASGLEYKTPTTTKYVQDFLSTDWVVAGGDASITILGATHNLTNPVVTVRELNGAVLKDTGVVVEVNTTTQNVVITIVATAVFAGRVILI